jgi:H/ACA ribonucleoprotein complex subunit 1
LFFYSLEVGLYVHPCKDEGVVKVNDTSLIPQFNAPVYLANKERVGKIEEVFGPMNEVVSF